MILVDVPMYYRRWNEGLNEGKIFLTISEGFYELFKCKAVNKNLSNWREDFMWMTPYFSFCYLVVVPPKKTLGKSMINK